ncbi:hypothetical protein IFM89_016901 [Coptis chinensis]|uniref:Uncharacterized protein n=1 Tax=Coptis chinensis TaxID=261450 RepID=A0A835I0N4_9MAGN|nr:hypothetical protein IFM89_016901 [Coptis chinensis]
MGWSHPDISFEDVLNLIKGFVDIIILSSGYQSSGHLATWDSSNIKKAIQWGLFFENVSTPFSFINALVYVFSRLRSSDDYQGSVEELDAALLEMKSVPSFPQWRSRNLLYLLNKRTLRLLSGAKLIFSAPKVQWLQVFERLKVSNEAHEDLEMIEIFLIGSVSSRWNRLIEHFLSVSHCFLPISAQYQEVQKLPHGRPQLLHSEQGHGIVEYLIALLSNQLNQLWKISPILAAIAIPLWCPLFRLYMLEIETQFKGDSSAIRCCSCIKDGKKHIDCELAERIWCLYAIHIQGANLMENTISP